MKHKLLTLLAAAFLFAACNNEKKGEDGKDDKMKTSSDDKKKEEPWVPVDSATMMKKMMEYGTPGPMHAMLASWDGTWTGEMTMWDYEGATPSKTPGTEVNSMIMNGKYQMSKHSGDMMGMPFEGMSITAYDNAVKKFTSTWIDTWSTGIMTMSGDWNESSKTLTMSGSYPDICRPGKECTMKQVMTVVDDNTHKMEMWGPDSKTGKEFKMMEITMVRKK